MCFLVGRTNFQKSAKKEKKTKKNSHLSRRASFAMDDTESLALLKEIQASLRSLQQEHRLLAASVDTLRGQASSGSSSSTTTTTGKDEAGSAAAQLPAMMMMINGGGASSSSSSAVGNVASDSGTAAALIDGETPAVGGLPSSSSFAAAAAAAGHAVVVDHASSGSTPDARRGGNSLTSRIILTTYPGQSGIDPLPMKWGAADPTERGPVAVSRHTSTVRRRNGEKWRFGEKES